MEKLSAVRKSESHKIPPDVLNSDLMFCIKEYVRLVKDRRILRDHWFRGLSFETLAEKYQVTTTAIKRVIYDVGDPILIRAALMSEAKQNENIQK